MEAPYGNPLPSLANMTRHPLPNIICSEGIIVFA